MTFHDVKLPDDVERGAVGGPRFKTTALQLSSGHEKRNINWEVARGEWNIGYGIQDKVGFTAVLDFYYARFGPAHTFRFKDWSDFEMARQSIGTTDGSTATFQIFKRYSSGAFNYDRDLVKPVSGTVLVWVNDVSITEGAGVSEFAVDLLTGIVTLGSTLAAQSSTDVEVQCEFDVQARFIADSFDMNIILFNAGSIPQASVREVRLEL